MTTMLENMPIEDSDEQVSDFVPVKSIKADVVINVAKIGLALCLDDMLNKTTALKAGTGQGKTTYVWMLVRQLLKQKPKMRVLIITRNRRAAIALTKKFNAVSYLDLNDDPLALVKAQIIVITPNSLPKLKLINGQTMKFDFVFVDESQSVHASFGDKTFKGGLASKAFDIYLEVLKAAKTRIFADATLDYLTLIVPDMLGLKVTVIENGYVDQTRIANRYEALDTMNMIWRRELSHAHPGTPVASAWSSKRHAHAEAGLLSEMYGEDQILVVSSDTQGGERVKAFLDSPDTEAQKYRGILYTSVMGNSIDIQLPIWHMFVFQLSARMSAEAIVQMAGRFRQARQLHIYQPATNSTRSTDWEYWSQRRYVQAVKTTSVAIQTVPRRVGFQYGISKRDEQLLNVLGFADAQYNNSLNQLQVHTDMLLKSQWRIVPVKGSINDRTITREREEWIDYAQEEFRHMVCEAEPVDDATYKQYQRTGELTPEIKAGHVRFTIENSLGLPVSIELVIAYEKNELTSTAHYLEYLECDFKAHIERDIHEIHGRYTLVERGHHHRKLQLIRLFIFMVIGQYYFDETCEYDKPTLEQRIQAFMEAQGEEFYTVMNWRSDHSKKPMQVLRRVLKEFGLEIKRGRRDRKSNIEYYNLDADLLTHRRYFAGLMGERKNNADTISNTIEKTQLDIEWASCPKPV